MPSLKIPLAGSITNRGSNPDSFADYDQQFLNCYPEVTQNAITGQAELNLLKRLGCTGTTVAGVGYSGVSGGLVWSGAGSVGVLLFFNSTTLNVYTTAGTQVGGSISNFQAWPQLTETMYQGLPTLTLTMKSSVDMLQHAYWCRVGDASWTEITDVDYPVNQYGSITASIAGQTLTATASSSGINLPIGTRLRGTGVDDSTRIIAIGTAIAGVGTYTVSVSQTVGSTTIYAGIETLGRMVHMDGYSFVMDWSGKIWNSDLNNITSWPATGFIQAQTLPDTGTGLGRTKNLVVAFGTNSIEFFQNNGNPVGSPLTRIASAAINIGTTTIGADSTPNIMEIGDAVYFFGTPLDQGLAGLYQLSGTSLKKISSPAIDKIINENLGAGVPGIAGTLRMHGMTHVVLYNGSASNIPVYCINTNVWWYMTMALAQPVRSCFPIQEKNYFVCTDRKIYTIDNASPTFQDDGVTITMLVRTSPIDAGTSNRQFVKSAELVCDSQTTSGNIEISWSDDDYDSFSTARTIDPSAGQRRIHRLGVTNRNYNNRRAWKIGETVNRPFRGKRLDIEFDAGTS